MRRLVVLLSLLFVCLSYCFADISKWTKQNFIDDFGDATESYYLQGVAEDQSVIIIEKGRIGFILPAYLYYDKWTIKTKALDGTINEYPGKRINNSSITITDKFYVDLFLTEIINSCKVIVIPDNSYSSEKYNLGEVSISYELVSEVCSDFYYFSSSNETNDYIAPNSGNSNISSNNEKNSSYINSAAVTRAKSYLKTSAFSRKGLIDQLVWEGYINSDATYAVDSLNIDWNEQAIKKAQSYLRYSSFSYSGLIDQLEFEGFTHSQAVYGVENSGSGLTNSSTSSEGNVQQAIKKAQSYLRYSAFSRKGLIDQLVFEGFSKNDATIAVDNLDVDWNEQAAKVAQSYRSWSSMSNSELKDQLIFEGFTSSQAQYGVSH